MVLDVRTIRADELHPWSVAVRRGFLNPAETDDSDLRRPFMPLDRTWGAFDDTKIVATLRSFAVELSLPGGGRLPAAAVTQVTTTATHRRQGLANRLVLADLAASRERGEPLSVLIAAEWPIYGRWGYGPATESQAFTVDTRRARVSGIASATPELVDRADYRAAAAKLYDEIRLHQPGEISRPDWFWDLDLGILQLPTKPEVPPAFHVLTRDIDGGVTGAMRYRVETSWEALLPAATVTVDSLFSSDVDSYLALWRYLFSLDLVTQVKIGDRAVDELIPLLLDDPRRARAEKRHDFLWCRVLDVPTVLSARRFRVEGSVVLGITDPQDLVAGNYELTGGPDGAACTPSTRSAEVTMPVSTLGAVLLGGYALRQFERAGWAHEERTGALSTADAMFSTSAAPWCNTWF